MSGFPTLPTGPLPHLAMDYARLREEGLRLLGRLAGRQWTDFNAHDPGITILEQLCYAITDLGYRTAYPMTELLAGGERGLPGPEAILTTDPVTAADLRKLALDVEGIGNAWVEEPDEAEVPFFHHAGSRELRLRPDPAAPDAAPVRLRGLQRIVLQTAEKVPGETALVSVAARLHAARGLGSDFQPVLQGAFQVGMRAAIEVGPVDDPAGVLAEIMERIEAYLAPRASFISRVEALARGKSTEEVFDGPLLDHGFIDLLPEPRRTVYVSDLLHTILDVPAVKAVRSLVLQGPRGPESWALQVPAGHVPSLAPTAELTLLRRDLPLRVDLAHVREHLEARRAERALATRLTGDGSGAFEPRRRDLTRHRSIQYQLPAAYGVGPLGLPASAPAERRAQARQLAAYLLIFDQLFANFLAQLAHARELLSHGDEGKRTYFAQPVEDPRLDLGALVAQEPAAHRAWLEGAVETGDSMERRKRFLGHLLARFAEELGDPSLIKLAGLPEAEDPDEALVADRRAFLRDYPRLSRARGSGYDVSRHGSAGAGSGFEERLRHKLGLRGGLRLHVVEHVLLRPLVEDLAQAAEEGDPQVPLLAGVSEPDPWSLQVSIVVEEPRYPDPKRPDPYFEQFVEETIRAETPAHLSVRLHWIGKSDGVDHWSAFDDAWEDFRAAYRDYRAAKLGGWDIPVDLQLRVRDARDRVIDLLGFGRTYPLRDLPLPEQIIVTPGTRAKIPLSFSQEDVIYELRDRASGRPVLDGGVPIAVHGAGGPIELTTPPIDVDVGYRILAVKREGAQTAERREAWLRTVVHVVEGVDPGLVAQIRLPLLDTRIDSPKPSDARLGAWGVQAEVEVLESQEGVSYELIEDAPDLSDVTRHRVVSQAPVVGTSGTIVLRTVAMPEDIDLRVRGRKATGDPANPVIRTGILELILPLRVRANPAPPVQLVPVVVAHGGNAVVRVSSTQASTEYTVYRGRVRDRDFVFGIRPGQLILDIPGDGYTVRLLRPPRPAVWQDFPGFAPAGAAARGNGATLELAIGGPGTADAFLLVKASKRHQTGRLGTGSAELPSAVQLSGAAALLVRPNPAQPLRLGVTLAGGATKGTLQVDGGQPGVFYEFRLDGQTQPVGRPAYFHQRDDENATLNKGIDQIRVEGDLVVPRDPAAPVATPAATPPLTPLLGTAALAAGSTLRVQARKAMSGLGAPLDRGAVLVAAPAVRAEPASVAPGASANIVIDASRTDERYWLLRSGQRVGAVVVGTGGRIALPTGALAARTVLTVAVTREDAATLAVERYVEVAVDVA